MRKFIVTIWFFFGGNYEKACAVYEFEEFIRAEGVEKKERYPEMGTKGRSIWWGLNIWVFAEGKTV